MRISDWSSDVCSSDLRGDLVCVKPAWLYDDRSGLVVIAGRESLIGHHLASGRNDTAARVLHDWRELFPDALYLELTRTGRDGEEAFNAAAVALADRMDRSEERRVGQECVSTCRSRWSPDHSKNNILYT